MKRTMIDVPSGWKYGYPKPLPTGTKDVMEWLLNEGYPQHEIDSCGDHFWTSEWEED